MQDSEKYYFGWVHKGNKPKGNNWHDNVIKYGNVMAFLHTDQLKHYPSKGT